MGGEAGSAAPPLKLIAEEERNGEGENSTSRVHASSEVVRLSAELRGPEMARLGQNTKRASEKKRI